MKVKSSCYNFLATKILRNKLHEMTPLNFGGESLPEYSIHRLLYILSTNPELVRFRLVLTTFQKDDETLLPVVSLITSTYPLKQTSHLALYKSLTPSNIFASNPDHSSLQSFYTHGLENLDKSCKMLEPWEVLLDMGQYSTYNYNYLSSVLSEFKEVNEKTMARTLLHLAVNHTGSQESMQRVV